MTILTVRTPGTAVDTAQRPGLLGRTLPTRMEKTANPGDKLDPCFRVRHARLKDVPGTISLAAISNLQASEDERLVSFAGSQQAARQSRQALAGLTIVIQVPALPAYSPATIDVTLTGGDGMTETLLALLREA
jgi:hypothetical protein